MDALFSLRSVDHHISALAPLEVRSAIRRLEMSSEITAEAAQLALQQLDVEMSNLRITPLSAEVVALAQQAIDQNQLRTLDALQLGTALFLSQTDPLVALTFVVADRRLLQAAANSGLRTLNPEMPT